MKSMEIRRKMFIGQECEGKEKGKKTLFIPKDAKEEELFYEIGQKYGISRFYFGAGNQRGISLNVIKKIELSRIKLDKNFILEIDNINSLIIIPDWILSQIQIVFVTPAPYYNVLNKVQFITSIKFISDDTLFWFDLSVPTKTSLNDIAYEQDYII